MNIANTNDEKFKKAVHPSLGRMRQETSTKHASDLGETEKKFLLEEIKWNAVWHEMQKCDRR